MQISPVDLRLFFLHCCVVVPGPFHLSSFHYYLNFFSNFSRRSIFAVIIAILFHVHTHTQKLYPVNLFRKYLYVNYNRGVIVRYFYSKSFVGDLLPFYQM